MKLLKQISLLITIVLLSNCNNSEQVELKLNYNLDDIQTIVTTNETNKGALMRLKTVIESNFKVSSINDNDITFKTNIVRIKTEMEKDDKVQSYDSNSTKEESLMSLGEKSMQEDFKKVLKEDYSIVIDNKNNVIKPLHYLNGNPVKEPVIDISNIFLRLPSKKVKVGSGWLSEKKNPLTDQITKTTCRVKEINDIEIIISLDLNISGIPGLFKDFKGNGEYILDKNTYKLIKGILSMKLHTGGSVTNTYETK